MRILAQCISWIALLGTIGPAVFYFLEQIDLNRCHWFMLLATIVWFAITPLWMGRQADAGPADASTPV